jgi:hypothetical protein
MGSCVSALAGISRQAAATILRTTHDFLPSVNYIVSGLGGQDGFRTVKSPFHHDEKEGGTS